VRRLSASGIGGLQQCSCSLRAAAHNVTSRSDDSINCTGSLLYPGDYVAAGYAKQQQQQLCSLPHNIRAAPQRNSSNTASLQHNLAYSP